MKEESESVTAPPDSDLARLFNLEKLLTKTVAKL